MAEKTACAKGCGMMLLPQHRMRHERACDGTPRESRPRTAKGKPKISKSTALAVRGRVERAVAVARRRQPLLTIPMLYERIRQQIADRETTIRILGELEAAL